MAIPGQQRTATVREDGGSARFGGLSGRKTVPNTRPASVWQHPAATASRRREPQYAASFRMAASIFSGLTMNQSSRTWLYGTPGTSGPAIRVTGPSR